MCIFIRYLEYLMDILAKHGLIKTEFHGKLLKTPKMVLSKVWEGVHFYIVVLWSTSNALPSFHQNKGFGHHLDTQNIIPCQKWGGIPHQNMSFCET